MKERPIIFSAPMVNAILAGKKTQTRRIVKSKHDLSCLDGSLAKNIRIAAAGIQFDWLSGIASIPTPCPYGIAGDRLWVREGWQWFGRELKGQPSGGFQYRADLSQKRFEDSPYSPDVSWALFMDARKIWNKWRPSIFMPRWASRITLEVVDVRVERLQDISEADAKAEGAQYTCEGCGNDPRKTREAEAHWQCDEDDDLAAGYRTGFKKSWNSKNGPDSWDANPWVWVVSFRSIDARKERG